MSVYATFSLLPPPPRHGLSTLPELTRGRLPDFFLQADPAEALRQWTRGLFYINLSDLWVHLWVCTGGIAALVLFEIFGIMGPRMCNKSFWLMRTLHKPEGVLWVPNSMMLFTIFAGIFGLVLVSWWPMLYRWFEQGHEPTSFWLFLLLCWLPLFSAAVMATYGLYFSLPPRFSFSVHRQTSVIFKPMVVNICTLALPVIHATTIIIPASIAHGKYLKSLRMYHAWQIKYATQAELSQAMIVEAQQCWYALFPVFRMASTCFFVWTAWAAVEAVCYIFLSVRLICVLRGQFKLSHKRVVRHDTEVSPPFGGEGLLDTLPRTPRTGKLDGRDSPDAAQVNSFFPKVSKSHIVHRQAPRADANDQLGYLRVVMYHVVVQLAGIGPGIVIYASIACYFAATLPRSIEGSQVETRWADNIKFPFLMASYSAVVIGTIVLFSIAKRSYDYEPVGTHLRGLNGEGNAGKNSRRVSRASGAGTAGAESPRGKGGRNMTTFFESETIQRPARALSPVPSVDTQDLERSSPVNQLGLDIGGHRRFSQTIVITDELEHVESVLGAKGSDSDVPASPLSARFALLRSLSGTTIAPEDSSSRSRDSASTFATRSPTYRLRSLSRNSRPSNKAG